jgi:hypothetical protein
MLDETRTRQALRERFIVFDASRRWSRGARISTRVRLPRREHLRKTPELVLGDMAAMTAGRTGDLGFRIYQAVVDVV